MVEIWQISIMAVFHKWATSYILKLKVGNIIKIYICKNNNFSWNKMMHLRDVNHHYYYWEWIIKKSKFNKWQNIKCQCFHNSLESSINKNYLFITIKNDVKIWFYQSLLIIKLVKYNNHWFSNHKIFRLNGHHHMRKEVESN